MDDVTTYLFGKRFPNRLFVGGLPVNTTALELADFFRKITRNVTEAKVILDEEGISKGYGFVTFQSKKDIETVMAMGTIFFKSKRLNLGPAVKKEGPTVLPETVIVPNARSYGQYYYPEPVPQYQHPTVTYQQASQQSLTYQYMYPTAYQPQVPPAWDHSALYFSMQPQMYTDPNTQFYQVGSTETTYPLPAYPLERRGSSTSSSDSDVPAKKINPKKRLPPRMRTRKREPAIRHS